MYKRRSMGLTIFGWIFIGLGARIILAIVYILCFKLRNIISQVKFVSSLASAVIGFTGFPFPKWLSPEKTIYILIFLFTLGIVDGLVHFISGIGILRLKAWARYLIITLMATYIISIPNKGLFWGWQSLGILEALVKILIPLFILWFFIRRKTKKVFETEGAKFKIKSKYGIIISLIVFFTLLFPSSLLIFKTYRSLKYKEPFFSIKPQIIRLKEINDRDFLDKYRRIELFDVSLLIPKDFIILSFVSLTKEDFNCILMNKDPTKRAAISLNNMKNVHEAILYKSGIFKQMKFKNAYDFERALHTNNWSPILIFFRKIGTPEGRDFVIGEIDSPRLKGFVRAGCNENGKRWMCILSLYSKDNRVYREAVIVYGEEHFSKNDVYNIISSFNFLKEKIEASEYYEKGLQALSSEDFITAQFKFANAYYLSPENPEYGYMLAKALFMNGDKRSFHGTQRILKDVLELKPDYEEAKDLLKIIESELSKEKK